MRQKTQFYVVWKGRQTGIFETWQECEAQVKGFPDAQYKAFTNRSTAERALQGEYVDYAGKASSCAEWLFAPFPPITDSYAVDAACSGSPGRLEYRCVQTASGKEIFRKGPYENGTNNIGEFLALVDALAWLRQRVIDSAVYSDSETAIAWVKAKKCNTKLRPDSSNRSLFDRVDKAEAWLQENIVTNPILKWDTEAWGEIPADFNRK